ncbi:hypothetical protein [Arthrobacter sp. EPSL27]|uniref:hypothetical protein n=1 Tax=Arthrobacter sp. EPSL27 TaxID=1745378 RepID=UPI000748452A|nr:hypothetical protein [Arthrobacter sp. EPSL27]KUM32801.1 hypothetical protein AR539_12300 [Arthrobacter sp. EPSL27]
MKASQDFITVEDSGRSDVPAGDSGMWDFREPADFTGKVEELSRFVEHLQVVGAGAVDRTRKQAGTAAAKLSVVDHRLA